MPEWRGGGEVRVRSTTPARLAVIDRFVYRRDYQRALLYADRAEQRNQDYSERDRLLIQLIRAESLVFLGKYSESEDICRRIIAGLQLGSEHDLYGRCCHILSVVYFHTGLLDQAIENSNLAHYTFRRAEDDYWIASSLNWLGGIVYCKGDYPQALRCFSDCQRFASKKEGLERWCVLARENQGRVNMLLGFATEATRGLLGTRKWLARHNEKLNVLRHDQALAYLCILKRQFNRAEKCLTAYTADQLEAFPAREHGIWYEYYGELDLSRGRLDEAAKHLQKAIAIGEESGPDLSLIGQSRRLLAQVRLAEGKLDDARAECELAYKAVRDVGERIEEGILDRVMGEILHQEGAFNEAHKQYQASITMLRMIGARVELGRTLLSAARLKELDRRQRLGYLLEAERLFGESGIPYWIEQVHRALESVFSEAAAVRPKRKSIHSGCGSIRFVTENPETRQMLQLAESWAASDLAILITGETGTGKDVLARYIHLVSARCDQPFVDIDLSTLTESLWESELFGHSKGTFTGAHAEKKGLLESADGGTVFLNEIGNLSLPLQAKLLEFLDSHEIRRLGATNRIKLNVRLIAATNSDLLAAVNEGQFRSDLYYRLNEAHLHLLPLRERPEDTPALIRHFLSEAGASEEAVAALNGAPWMQRAMRQSWVGNARQLGAFVGRLMSVADVNDPSTWSTWAEFLLNHNERVEDLDRQEDGAGKAQVLKALEENNWNQRAAARDLRLHESSLRRLMRRCGIARPEV